MVLASTAITLVIEGLREKGVGGVAGGPYKVSISFLSFIRSLSLNRQKGTPELQNLGSSPRMRRERKLELPLFLRRFPRSGFCRVGD